MVNGGSGGSGSGATAGSGTAGRTPGQLRLRALGWGGERGAVGGGNRAVRAASEPWAPPLKFSPATQTRDKERRATEGITRIQPPHAGGGCAGHRDGERSRATLVRQAWPRPWS